MNLDYLRNEAIVLFDEWKLDGWEFRLGKRARSLGVCKYSERVIEVSEHHAINDAEDIVLDTLKHEIAHAVAWIRYRATGHCDTWKAVAREVGCTPAGCETTAQSIIHRLTKQRGKYQATCPGCKREFDWHRKPKHMVGKYCVPCGEVKGLLIIKEAK